jgi:UDP-N-acetylmuramoylalanine--D-glutamate ligase
VLGLARSGQAAARALAARGEQVIGVDAGAPEGAGALEDAGVELHLDSDGAALAARARTLIESPGVPHGAPLARAARERGLTVLGELELGWRLLANPLIAVTGTNGKTTTVELIGEIWRRAGRPVAVAGNVGTPLTSLAGALDDDAVIVCETSSFQLEDTVAFVPDVAVLLNVSEDHLDRHGTMDDYVAAKRQAFSRQGDGDIAIVPADAAGAAGPGGAWLGGAARRVRFGPGGDSDCLEREGALWWHRERLLASDDIAMRGPHNRLNAMAAAATALAAGVDVDAVREALRSFRGVPHRLEEVSRIRDVLYVNDSKATNVDSTLVALCSFAPGSVHLIAGGRAKSGYDALSEPVAERCAAVYLIGEAADALAAALGGSGVALARCGTLERAVAAASNAASAGEVVLLSPACASYDQFESFEQRGARFRELVDALG